MACIIGSSCSIISILRSWTHSQIDGLVYGCNNSIVWAMEFNAVLHQAMEISYILTYTHKPKTYAKSLPFGVLW